MKISLTEFIDFIGATGTTRLTKVRKAKCRGIYSPVVVSLIYLNLNVYRHQVPTARGRVTTTYLFRLRSFHGVLIGKRSNISIVRSSI